MTPLLLEAEHEAAGAIFGAEDRAVVRSYGDPQTEYVALRNGAGLTERSDRVLFRMWGRDPIRMLNGLITNDLAALAEGRAVYGAMLTARGRIISDVRVFRSAAEGEPELLIDVPELAATEVAAHLRKFVPPLFARWESLAGRFAILGCYGPRSGELLSRWLDAELPASEDALLQLEWQGASLTVIATAIAGDGAGYDLVIPAEQAADLWRALVQSDAAGARPVGFAALECARIEAGRPRFGIDFSEETLPAEAFEATGQMKRAISFSKGCYTGQEVVVRIAHRGRVNRHLRGLLLGEAPTPAAKTPLFEGGSDREIGWTTSAALSPRMGQTIALGYVRREFEPGAVVHLGAPDGLPVEVVEVPFQPSGDAE